MGEHLLQQTEVERMVRMGMMATVVMAVGIAMATQLGLKDQSTTSF
jgi:hypothetical protein